MQYIINTNVELLNDKMTGYWRTANLRTQRLEALIACKQVGIAFSSLFMPRLRPYQGCFAVSADAGLRFECRLPAQRHGIDTASSDHDGNAHHNLRQCQSHAHISCNFSVEGHVSYKLVSTNISQACAITFSRLGKSQGHSGAAAPRHPRVAHNRSSTTRYYEPASSALFSHIRTSPLAAFCMRVTRSATTHIY